MSSHDESSENPQEKPKKQRLIKISWCLHEVRKEGMTIGMRVHPTNHHQVVPLQRL